MPLKNSWRHCSPREPRGSRAVGTLVDVKSQLFNCSILGKFMVTGRVLPQDCSLSHSYVNRCSNFFIVGQVSKFFMVNEARGRKGGEGCTTSRFISMMRDILIFKLQNFRIAVEVLYFKPI